MNKPVPPIIFIGDKHSILFMFTAPMEEVDKVSLGTYWKINADKDLYFDSHGNIWDYSFHQPQPDYPKTWWRILLAETIYNPWIQVKTQWQKAGEYDYDDLKQLCIQCIENDEDILTQYVDPDYLIEKVASTTSFEELVAVLNTYVFEVDEEELYKECG